MKNCLSQVKLSQSLTKCFWQKKLEIKLKNSVFILFPSLHLTNPCSAFFVRPKLIQITLLQSNLPSFSVKQTKNKIKGPPKSCSTSVWRIEIIHFIQTTSKKKLWVFFTHAVWKPFSCLTFVVVAYWLKMYVRSSNCTAEWIYIFFTSYRWKTSFHSHFERHSLCTRFVFEARLQKMVTKKERVYKH